MKCWKCGAEQPDITYGKLSFRALCDKCSAWLHCCKNCKNYRPGLPNDCFIHGTEQIADREASNFCEEFKLSGQGPELTGDSNKAEQKLFKDKDQNPTRKGFNELFNEA